MSLLRWLHSLWQVTFKIKELNLLTKGSLLFWQVIPSVYALNPELTKAPTELLESLERLFAACWRLQLLPAELTLERSSFLSPRHHGSKAHLTGAASLCPVIYKVVAKNIYWSF